MQKTVDIEDDLIEGGTRVGALVRIIAQQIGVEEKLVDLRWRKMYLLPKNMLISELGEKDLGVLELDINYLVKINVFGVKGELQIPRDYTLLQVAELTKKRFLHLFDVDQSLGIGKYYTSWISIYESNKKIKDLAGENDDPIFSPDSILFIIPTIDLTIKQLNAEDFVCKNIDTTKSLRALIPASLNISWESNFACSDTFCEEANFDISLPFYTLGLTKNTILYIIRNEPCSYTLLPNVLFSNNLRCMRQATLKHVLAQVRGYGYSFEDQIRFVVEGKKYLITEEEYKDVLINGKKIIIEFPLYVEVSGLPTGETINKKYEELLSADSLRKDIDKDINLPFYYLYIRYEFDPSNKLVFEMDYSTPELALRHFRSNRFIIYVGTDLNMKITASIYAHSSIPNIEVTSTFDTLSVGMIKERFASKLGLRELEKDNLELIVQESPLKEIRLDAHPDSALIKDIYNVSWDKGRSFGTLPILANYNLTLLIENRVLNTTTLYLTPYNLPFSHLVSYFYSLISISQPSFPSLYSLSLSLSSVDSLELSRWETPLSYRPLERLLRPYSLLLYRSALFISLTLELRCEGKEENKIVGTFNDNQALWLFESEEQEVCAPLTPSHKGAIWINGEEVESLRWTTSLAELGARDGALVRFWFDC